MTFAGSKSVATTLRISFPRPSPHPHTQPSQPHSPPPPPPCLFVCLDVGFVFVLFFFGGGVVCGGVFWGVFWLGFFWVFFLCINHMGLIALSSEYDRSPLKSSSVSSSSFLWTVFAKDSPRLINLSMATILPISNVCTRQWGLRLRKACAFRDLWAGRELGLKWDNN